MINIINRKENQYADGSNIMRHFSPEYIIKQLIHLRNNGVKNLKIADEMFVLNPNHFLKICDLIIKNELSFNIWCYARIDTIKDEYLEKMQKAGVRWLGLGIESGVQSVRKDVIKGKFEEIDIQKVVAKIRSHGINVAANYIFGLPEDSFLTMQATLDLAVSLNTEMANFYSCMAYPGSPLYKQAIDEGWILPGSYAGYSQHSYECTPIGTKYVTPEEVLRFRDEAWMEYHDRDEYYIQLVKKFGYKASRITMESTKIKLKRQLLGD